MRRFFAGRDVETVEEDPRTAFTVPQRKKGGPSGSSGGGRGITGGDVAPGAVCPCCGQRHTSDTHPVQDVNGRYDGGNHMLVAELRVDFAVSGVISGDLFGTTFTSRDYLASFRTAPGTKVAIDDTQPWPVIFETRDGEIALGDMVITDGTNPGALLVSLWIDGQLPGLPAREIFEVTVSWQSPMMRRLAVEVETETGTVPPPTYDLADNTKVTYVSAFADAGIEIVDSGGTSTVPRNEDGWGSAQLHGLMTQMASANLTKAAWAQQLLWLGKPTRSRLLGVMFDTTAQLPRQGTAVFDTEIRDLITDEVERKVLQTAVHELGHSLNLAHRFEREVGRADSTSFMNYDWRYKGGNRTREFWDKFSFSFDPDELEFLRHAPRNQVIPGGAAFHSVSYWADGSGGYSPYLPEAPLDIVALELIPPALGTTFAFGQPIFLQVRLTNVGNEPLNLDQRLLDPKGNFLQISVRKLDNGLSGSGAFEQFHPIVERCLDLDPRTFDVVQNGEFIEDNIQINFGSGGFSFAEPGHYEVQVFGSLFVNTNDNDPLNDRELVVASNSLHIYVQHPETLVDEIEVATVIQREDVGVYFALGGSAVLCEAEEKLAEVVKRRNKDKKGKLDRITATILRCQGIDVGRRYPPASLGTRRSIPGDRAKAAKILDSLGTEGLKVFDACTASATKRLARRHKDATG